MYQRKRSPEYNERDPKYRSNQASSSFWKITLLLIIVSSCAHRFSEGELSDPSALVSELSSKVCLSGEGQGRLSAGLKSVSFRFESLRSENRWAIGAHIPLRGEEALVLEGIDKGKMVMSGSLARRLRRAKGAFAFLAKILNGKGEACKITRSSSDEVAGVCSGVTVRAKPGMIRFEKRDYYLQAQGHPSDKFGQVELGVIKKVKMELSYLSCTK